MRNSRQAYAKLVLKIQIRYCFSYKIHTQIEQKGRGVCHVACLVRLCGHGHVICYKVTGVKSLTASLTERQSTKYFVRFKGKKCGLSAIASASIS